jgi:hypothetical protein
LTRTADRGDETAVRELNRVVIARLADQRRPGTDCARAWSGSPREHSPRTRPRNARPADQRRPRQGSPGEHHRYARRSSSPGAARRPPSSSPHAAGGGAAPGAAQRDRPSTTPSPRLPRPRPPPGHRWARHHQRARHRHRQHRNQLTKVLQTTNATHRQQVHYLIKVKRLSFGALRMPRRVHGWGPPP